jgi:cytosine permease
MAEVSERRIDAALEDYGTKPVPIEKTRNWFNMGIVIWGVNVCIPAFMVGGMVASMTGLGSAIVAILLGSVILTAVSIATGIIGAHTRISTSMTTKLTYGINGNVLMAILLFIGAFGWFAVQLEVFAQAITGAVDILSGGSLTIQRWVPIIIGGILMTLTAMYGFRAIEKLTVFVIPILLVLLAVTLLKAYQDVGVAEVFARRPEQMLPLGLIVSIVAGGMAVGSVIMPDITRYGKSKGHAAGGMVFGMLVGFPLVLVLAAYLFGAAGISQFAEVMLKYHRGAWGIFAMFTIVFATWTTNDNNLYSASLAFNSMFPKMHKWILAVIGGAVGIILALFGIVGQFMNWLIILGVTIPPIGAVMAADFFLFRAKLYSYERLKEMPGVRIVSLISWVIGTVVGFLAFFKVLKFTSAPALDAIVVSIVIHVILMLATGHKISLKER